MVVADFSPAAAPTTEQQVDALRKGLGRVMQWVKSGQLDPDCLLDACRTDYRFDQQVEDSRGDWLWSIVEANDCVDALRADIFASLHDLSDERSAKQRCELGFHYAKNGDEAFRTRLYEIVRQRLVPARPWIGERELIALDGIEGFLTVAQARGAQLADREWEWDDEKIVDEALHRFGSDQIEASLEKTVDTAIRRFRDAWIRDRGTPKQTNGVTHKERMRAITVAEIFAAAESDGGSVGLFRGWGTHADETELELVFERLLNAQEPRVIAKYLRVFSNRPMPQFDSRLLGLCHHPDDDVCRRAYSAFEHLVDPAVREFALRETAGGIRNGDVVSLFIKNYVRGDEWIIHDAINLPDDPCEVHWLLMDVIKLLERNPDADCSRLALVAYAKTPCTKCRQDAVKLLLEQKCAPPWVLSECSFDSDPETRELVQNDRVDAEPKDP